MVQSKLDTWALQHGFKPTSVPGFSAYERVGADRAIQSLGLFRWSNTKVADAAGIPRAYLVAVLAESVALLRESFIPRIQVPLVEWPSKDQLRRSWRDVAEELDEVVTPFLDASTAVQVAALTEHLLNNERNLLRHPWA